MQSRRQSLIETCTSLVVGFVISYFTVLSFIRGYALRRFFNHLHKGDFQ